MKEHHGSLGGCPPKISPADPRCRIFIYTRLCDIGHEGPPLDINFQVCPNQSPCVKPPSKTSSVVTYPDRNIRVLSIPAPYILMVTCNLRVRVFRKNQEQVVFNYRQTGELTSPITICLGLERKFQTFEGK